MSDILVIIFHNDSQDTDGKIKQALENNKMKINIAHKKVVAWQEVNSIIADGIEENSYKFVMVYDDKWIRLPDDKIENAGKRAVQTFVAWHSKNFIGSQKDGLNQKFPDRCMFFEYSHTKGNPIYDNAAKLIEATREEIFNGSLKAMIEYFQKHGKESLIGSILSLFLPLDIDMQAIKILINEKKNLEQAEAYLKEMLAESTNYHKSILNNYGERFNKLLDQVEDQKSKEKVQAVLGMGEEEELKIKDLLERISNLKSNDIEKEFFNNSQNNQLKTEIISFHSWYEKLARTLSEL